MLVKINDNVLQAIKGTAKVAIGLAGSYFACKYFKQSVRVVADGVEDAIKATATKVPENKNKKWYNKKHH